MAEGGNDFNLSTEWQLVTLDDMASSAVVQTVYHSPEDVETTLPTSNFSEDFISFCKDVEGWLIDLDKTYGIFSEVDIEQLGETGRQLREKQILISFVGHLNVGKSTLLNALLGVELLPIRMAAETGIRVHIHHDAGDPKATSDQHPKLIVGKGRQVPPEEVVGVTEIYKKLETLNKSVREGAEGREKVCTIKTNAPVLTNAPSNWQVVLVDTPGTGEFNSRVAVAAEGAVKSSSAYVFVTTYGELESAENANFLRFLHEYDQGILEGRRLIIVVTQFDRTYTPNNTRGEITVQEVYAKVHQLVSEACPHVEISRDDVLPVSGLWAYNARMLISHPYGPERDKYRRNVEWYLSHCQSLPCGQGESQISYFTRKSDDELAKQLLDVSGLDSIEERIHNVTKSCIKVWVSKIKGDYERSLEQAREKLLRQSQSELEQQKKQVEECSQIHECLGVIDEERHDLEETMEVKLYTDLRKMCPQTQEVSERLEQGRQMVLDGIKDFRMQCKEKVRNERVTFGKEEFDGDVTAFLEKMSTGLEQISTPSSWFQQLNDVLTVRTTEMGASIQRMKDKVQQLGATPGQNTFQENALEASQGGYPRAYIGPKLIHKFTLEALEFPSAIRRWWTPLMEAFKKVIALFTDTAQSSTCRFWNATQEATMSRFEEQLKRECDNYFNNIKSHILKYFHDQYCLETKDRLIILDGECKAKIEGGRRQLKMLNESLLNIKRNRNELQESVEHLEKLATDLHTKADNYISSISD